MRRFVGCGPFLPPTSWRDVPRKEAEATPKETDAILIKSHEHDLGLNLELMNHDDTLDELVKMLDIEGVVAADDMQLEQFKKEIKEGTLDPRNALFDLLRVFDDELAPLVKEEEKDFNILGIKMEVDPPPDIRIIVPPPGSETSGYSSGSSVGGLSPPGPYFSINDIKTENGFEDEDRGNRPFSLGSIKMEVEEDHDDHASWELPGIGPMELKFDLSGELKADFEIYTMFKNYHAQYGTGEWESGENGPGPELQLIELVYAAAELEHQMQLDDHEKWIRIEPNPAEDDEEEDQSDAEDDDDEEETEEEEFDSGMEDSYTSD